MTRPPLCARRFGDAPEEDLTVPADMVLVASPLAAPATVPDAMLEALLALALVFMVDDTVELEPDLAVAEADVSALAVVDDEASAFMVAEDEPPGFPVAVEVEVVPATIADVDLSAFVVDC